MKGRTRNHLTLLLGAGYSQALGIPGTRAIGDAVDIALGHFGLAFSDLRQRLVARFKDNYNFEVLAAALELCGAYEPPSYLSTPPYQTVIPDVADLHNGLDYKVTSAMYERLMQVVMKAVTADWTTSVNTGVPGAMGNTIYRLRNSFVLNISTLNYDQGAEHFVQDAADGFVGNGALLEFDPRSFLEATGDKIGHLHGSSLFVFPEAKDGIRKMRNPGSFQQPLWRRRLDASYYSAIVTGSSKPEKLTMPPYNFYYNWLANELLRSPRLLIAGYGGADPHINVWLAHAAQVHGSNFRVVFIDKFHQKPPDRLRWLIGISEGLGTEPEAEPTFDARTLNNGVARLARSLVFSTGLPLTCEQTEQVLDFFYS